MGEHHAAYSKSVMYCMMYHRQSENWIGIIRGSLLSWIHSPASAQSILPDCLSTRRSTYHSPTVITSVSVVSNGVSDAHLIEMRVVKLDSKAGTDTFDILGGGDIFQNVRLL